VNLLTWNHACSVGVRAMDDQHGILMDAMNDLRLAVVHGSSGAEVHALLDQTVAFTRLHFESEERLMERTAFPGTVEHRAEHLRMLTDIHRWAERLRFGEGMNITSLVWFLQGGYTEHIANSDQQYSGWFHEHGIY
jgi:hemerythrin